MVTVRPARPEELAEVGELTVRAYVDDGLVDGAPGGYVDELRDAEGRAATPSCSWRSTRPGRWSAR